MLDNQLFGRFETFQIVNYQAFRMFILLHSAVSHMENGRTDGAESADGNGFFY